ncbi:MAG: hypothetical protein J6U02_00580 [Elusimicrobia bacterium]|nr:hypothetical protein [Elusimicrobiota bacterium]
MYGFILFKNVRGTTKLNLQLSKGLDSLADLTDEQATIINYMTNKNNYNFTLSSELDLNAITIDEKSINLTYCKEVIENGRKAN